MRDGPSIRAQASRQSSGRNAPADRRRDDELHEERGAAETTISEIAKRAGVGRVTVYRHFPDEEALYAACSGHYFSQHPFPDLERWRQIPLPADRLRVALRETYAWHAENQQMIGMALAEARDLPLMAPYHGYWASACDVLAAPWDVHGRRRSILRATIALALSFDTHRTSSRSSGSA